MTDDERKQWLEERRKGIGGSDAAGVLGLSPWTTPLQVYEAKLGIGTPVEETWPMKWGTWLEPHLRQAYADATGNAVLAHSGVLRHPRHDWMLATLDGMTEHGRVVEFKTSRSDRGWGEPGSADIPEHYLVQVQHYLCVTGAPVADVVLGLYGQPPRIYEVEADRELQELILDREAAFWDRVQRQDPPDPINLADTLRRFRDAIEGTVLATQETRRAVESLRDIRAQAKALEAREEVVKAEILKAMGDLDTLVSPDTGEVLATWKQAKAPVRFDAKALQAALPDVYKQYLKAGEASRRFLLK